MLCIRLPFWFAVVSRLFRVAAKQQKNNALSPALPRRFQSCAHGAHTKFIIYYLLSLI